MKSLFIQQVQRELLLNSRQYNLLINSCLFYLMILVFFPLSMPADPQLLRTIAPGIFWMALLLSLLLSAERLFQQDYEDGVLEQWIVAGTSMSLLVCAKIITQWVLNIIPIILFTPLIALLFDLKAFEIFILEVSLFLGSPAILYLCALVAAFSLGIKQKGIFMALILLPLTIPILIFGSSALQLAMQQLPTNGILALLLAISLIAITLLPFAIASVIRFSLAE
ncbi:heme exporter protein CcmB (plasmid) [Legionella adelaidensis]|uniref:Heme exporter protein B n=1 Tax=Legionella adelaidensis TaxID=45056 RepID=A0A0W0R4E1_9GAMM|nr:heme exporter protein CcmB [Legionella adelaidensis]KTC65911.1 heme exporter protein CcmB [Legionella adelaidensis]VEH85531.1 heme exporter protein CcmB [Legionella adelaidensis]